MQLTLNKRKIAESNCIFLCFIVCKIIGHKEEPNWNQITAGAPFRSITLQEFYFGLSQPNQNEKIVVILLTWNWWRHNQRNSLMLWVRKRSSCWEIYLEPVQVQRSKIFNKWKGCSILTYHLKSPNTYF